MKNLYIHYILIFFIAVFNTFPCSYASENYFDKILAKSSLQEGRTYYKGYTYNGKEYEAEVESQLSLGGRYTEAVRKAITDSNQFCVAFMYRLNHPALIYDLAYKVDQFQNKNKNQEIKYAPLIFLDYNSFFAKNDYTYKSYVNHLLYNVPVSFVKIGEGGYKNTHKTFHHKIIICKETGKEASVFIGSANATYHADNMHSEDTLIIKSNILAKSILSEFYSLFNSYIVSIIDVPKFDNQKKHTNYLLDFYNIVHEEIKPSITNIEQPKIKSFVISTGVGEKNTCFNFINENILEKDNNELLIYFQNYLNIYKNPNNKDYFEPLRNYLSEKKPLKLVVRWDNVSRGKKSKDNFTKERNYFKSLEEQKNIYFINFKPYTQGKFHHKAIIQYLKDEEPILYSGSFHFSSNAIKNNSENIIGVRSKTLVEDYLYSLLWNSNLADHIKIWQFFKEGENQRRFGLYNQGTKINSLACRVLSRCKINIHGYTPILKKHIKKLINNLSEGPSSIRKKVEKVTSILKQYKNSLKLDEYLESIGIITSINNMFLTDTNKENIIGDNIKKYISLICAKCIEPNSKYLEKKPTMLKRIKKLSLGLDELKQKDYEKWIDVVKEIIDNAKLKSYDDIIKLHKKDKISLTYNERADLEVTLERLENYLDNIKSIYNSMIDLHEFYTSINNLVDLYAELRPFDHNPLNLSISIRELNISPSNINKKVLKRTRSSPVPKKQRKNFNLESVENLSEEQDISSTINSLLKLVKIEEMPNSTSRKTDFIEKLEMFNRDIVRNASNISYLKEQIMPNLNDTHEKGTIGYYLTNYITQKGEELIRYPADKIRYNEEIETLKKYDDKDNINKINYLIQKMYYNSGRSIDNENYAKEYLERLVKKINRLYEVVDLKIKKLEDSKKQ